MAETPDSRPARLLGSLYSPPDERPVIEALLGIESEVATSLRAGVDHGVAHVRLQWWRDECERAVKGQAVHPLTQALAREFATRGEPALAGLAGFVDTAVWDLASATFGTRRERTAYCERWASAMVLPAVAHATMSLADASDAGGPVGDAGPGTDSTATPVPSGWLAIGAAIREIELLTEVASEAHAGRLRIPLDELEANGLDAESLAKNPWPASLAALLATRHQALRAQLERGVATVRETAQPAVRGLLAWTALAWRQSKRAQAALPNQRRPGRSDTLADAWVAWRAARRAARCRFTLP